MSETPWINLWRALQELGACINVIAESSDEVGPWFEALALAVDEAQDPAEEAAMAEDPTP